MATITKIEEQKNKKRVNIFVDDAFFCGMCKETAIIFGLKVGKQVEAAELERAVESSEVKMAFDKASDYIAVREHSKKELLQKLKNKGYEEKIAKLAIAKLEDYGYVNDEQFALHFVGENKRLSRQMLMVKLKQKGVDAEIISSVLGSRSNDEELAACQRYAESYARGKDLSDPKTRQKMFASLLRRGFSVEIIRLACGKITKNLEDFDEID